MPFIALILFGVLAASFALIFELLATGLAAVSLSPETLSAGTLGILLSIASIEEIAKYLFLRQYARRFLTADRCTLPYALLCGVGFGSGFAALEFFLSQNGVAAIPAPALIGTAGLHIATSSALAVTLFSSAQKTSFRFFVLALAILVHTAYNATVLLLP